MVLASNKHSFLQHHYFQKLQLSNRSSDIPSGCRFLFLNIGDYVHNLYLWEFHFGVALAWSNGPNVLQQLEEIVWLNFI